MTRRSGPYTPPPSLLPFEAFRWGVALARAEREQAASIALCAEGRRVAGLLMGGWAA